MAGNWPCHLERSCVMAKSVLGGMYSGDGNCRLVDYQKIGCRLRTSVYGQCCILLLGEPNLGVVGRRTPPGTKRPQTISPPGGTTLGGVTTAGGSSRRPSLMTAFGYDN